MTHRRRGKTARTCLPGIVALALGLLMPPWHMAGVAGITLHATGSTLLFPLFQRWVAAYTQANPGIVIDTGATGSGAGIDAAVAGKVQIGASDAFMSEEQAARYPEIMNIPLAISAQTVNYNQPKLNDTALKLDGPTIAGIYSGKIRTWDAPQITVLNPGVRLPHETIVPIRHDDRSGDTFLFTQFLDFSTQTWENSVGYGTAVIWPSVSGEQAVTGNDGMVKAIAATPWSIGDIGISFRNEIAGAGLGTAMVGNQAGKFLLPTPATVSAAADQLDPRTPADERLSLAFAPGDDSYPLINYEYAVVSAKQDNAAAAAAIRQFLLWTIAVDGGNAAKFMDEVGFIALPDFIRALSEKQIKRIE